MCRIKIPSHKSHISQESHQSQHPTSPLCVE